MVIHLLTMTKSFRVSPKSVQTDVVDADFIPKLVLRSRQLSSHTWRV